MITAFISIRHMIALLYAYLLYKKNVTIQRNEALFLTLYYGVEYLLSEHYRSLDLCNNGLHF